MPIYIGNNKIKSVYFGTQKLKSIYVGDKKVWSGFEKPTFTGSHAYFSDANYEWLECYGDGTLTADGIFDICLVGGGGNADEMPENSYVYFSGGAGSGEVLNQQNTEMAGEYTVKIGSGGSPSSIVGKSLNKVATAGNTNSNKEAGADGMSGGGASGTFKTQGGKGGSNGSDGESTDESSLAWMPPPEGGKGKYITTKEFGDGKLLAGGGGGAGAIAGEGGEGGGGFGGSGNDNLSGVDGTPNTGSGAGGVLIRPSLSGGSGLFAIRWKKAS